MRENRQMPFTTFTGGRKQSRVRLLGIFFGGRGWGKCVESEAIQEW